MNIKSAVFSLLALVLAGCSMLPAKDIDVDKYNSVDDMISAELSSEEKINIVRVTGGTRVSPFFKDHSYTFYNNLKKYCESKDAGRFKRLHGPERGTYLDSDNIINRVGIFSCEKNNQTLWNVSIVAEVKHERPPGSGILEHNIYIKAVAISESIANAIIRQARERKQREALLKQQEQRQKVIDEKKNLIALQHMADFGYGTYLCYEENLGEKRTLARFRRVRENGWLEVVVLKKIIGFNTELPYSVGKTELISDPRGWGLCPTR